ncbi:hypothetical protein TRIATDRAFT_299982 [Trichoderma atroviride IMI 206040]|uniref:Uncharacterized protein n=1 Tax=Hypocrea atroviridis (strain ATCC 20476 / IMI 206040) TaxID=452589 RepID=G9NWF0_HYPAI|nr:uncharacterized protein TRIATDRAFT_299982 [Trichoderma atroviride IMI 206040]EHK45310.1 hypothetical protein TRIATDRAFT_299982 [Trichoderma atroviride IMI 206040]
MLLVGKLAVGRYFWLRHDQVVGRERPACAKLSKERCRTHINLGSTTRARAQALGTWFQKDPMKRGKGCKRMQKGDE